MTTRRRRLALTGSALLAPAFCYILLIVIYPLLYAVWASFTNLRLTKPATDFVWFDTYAAALGSGIVHDSLIVTAIFLVASVALELVLGLLLALSFHRMRRNHPLLRSLLLLPMMVTPVSVGLIWKLVLNSDFGVLTAAAQALGLGRVLWLSDPGLARVSIVLMDVWQWTPFMFLILLAGLESLPSEPLESAEVDGARWRHKLFLVTLPLLRRILTIAVVFRLMFAVATFDTVFVLTKGGPARATDLISLLIQREGLVNLNIAYAAALSFLLLVAVLVTVTLLFRRTIAHAD